MVEGIALLVWLVAGCILAAPYTFLAGGNFENFFLTAWVSPIGALVLYATWASPYGRKKGRWHNPLFWWVLAFCLLPIVLNGVSRWVGWLGYETVSGYIFAARYLSLYCIIMAVMVGALLANMICAATSGMRSLCQRFFTGPPPSKPSGGPPRQDAREPEPEKPLDPASFRISPA